MKREEQIPKSDRFFEAKQGKLPFFASSAGKMISGLLLLVIVALILLRTLGGESRSVTIGIDGKALGVAFTKTDPVFVPLSEIQEVSLTEKAVSGEAVEPLEWDEGFAGVYSNEEFGMYTMYCYFQTSECIVVKYKDGVLIFNGKSRKQTEAYFRKLEKALGLQ